MRVRRIKRVIVVFRPTVRKKEALTPELVTTFERQLQINSTNIAGLPDPRERQQHVSGVKIIDPFLSRPGAIGPGAIFTLSSHNITGGTPRQIKQLKLAR